MRRFRLHVKLFDFSEASRQSIKAYLPDFLDILHVNSTLSYLEPWPTEFSKGTEAETVGHLLNLNRCGKKLARDPSTSVEQVLALLHAVPEKIVAAPTDDRDALTLSSQYGLLQEAVSKWAASN